MFDSVKRFVKKHVSAVCAAITGVLASFGYSHAALSLDQQAVVDGINTMITDLTTVAWAMVLAILTVMIGIKLVKKFLGKAT